MNPFKTPGKHKWDMSKARIVISVLEDEDLIFKIENMMYIVKYCGVKSKKRKDFSRRDLSIMLKALDTAFGAEMYGKALDIRNSCVELLK